jgi:hypothetical protein
MPAALLLPSGGAILLASLACCLLATSHHRKVRKAQDSLAVAKGPYDPAHAGAHWTPSSRGQGLTGWLFGYSTAGSSGEGCDLSQCDYRCVMMTGKPHWVAVWTLNCRIIR